MAASEFAKRQLKKHGWTEGSGLGKQEHGRSDPIKVTLKMDKTGVGHDPGKEFTDHWWLRVFNEAAQKIGKNQKDDSKPKKVGGQKQNKVTEMKNNLYMGFVKSSTLTNGVEEKHKHSDSSSEGSSDGENNTSVPTLNDIHKFCGGATGHKAARFGIKMGGKLARIASHEKMFEEQLKTKKQSEFMSQTDSSRNNSLHDAVDQPSLTSIESCENGGEKRKKKKHREKSEAECSEDYVANSQCVNEENVVNELSQDVCKKNKKQKHKQIYKEKSKRECSEDYVANSQYVNEEHVNNELSEDVCKKNTKRKHKQIYKEKSKRECSEDFITNSQYVNEENVNNELSEDVCKKNTKRKHKKKKCATSDDGGVVKCEGDECDIFNANKGQQHSDNICDKKKKRHHAADEETVNENSLAEIKIKKKKKKKSKV